MLLNFEQLVVKYNLQIKGIIHCGANECQEKDIYERFGIKPVFWIEAIPEVFDKMKVILRSYERNFHLCACLSDTDNQTVDFNISNNGMQSSSMLEMGEHLNIHPGINFERKIRLKTTRLDTIFSTYNLNGYLINLDLQGAELMALKGLGEKLSEVSALYMEVNKKETYKGCALVEDVDTYLGKYGFVRVETGGWVGDSWSDALYLRK